jgi:hypothetical protein
MNEANQESSRMDQLKLVAGLEDAVFVHHLQLWFIDSENKSRSLPVQRWDNGILVTIMASIDLVAEFNTSGCCLLECPDHISNR